MSCHIDSDCPFLFNCGADQVCYHDPIFPLQLYPCFVYIFFPLAVGLVNMAGNSMGIFKVLMLNNLLRYDIGDSTAMIQPMVAGAAFPNFFNIIIKKHPLWNSSLVDFNIVIVLIPCCLLGSTLGSFLQNFIPEIFQDLLVVLLFSFFALQFIRKLKTLRKGVPQNPIEAENEEHKDSLLSNPALEDNSDNQLSEEQQNRKATIQKYQETIHLKDIAISFGVFIIFEFFVFLVQGKLPFYKFTHCSVWYFVGLLVLVAMTFGYLHFLRVHLAHKFEEYKSLFIPFNIDLSQGKLFRAIGLGAFSAGMVQGILGVGSGTVIMGVFLALNLNPRVASATSGYQVFFIGAASFVEGFITNQIGLNDALFLFGICAVGGGAVTVAMYAYLKKKDEKVVNKLLVTIIVVLCAISVVGVFPSAIQTWMEFGWSYMIKIKFHC